MIYVYVRVSDKTLETANQLHVLSARFQGETVEVIEETRSGGKVRPKLDGLIARLVAGDTLAVYALDRLGRRCAELCALMNTLTARGVNFVSHRENIDLSTITGKFMSHIFAAFAEMERDLIRERTRISLDRRRAEGKPIGRKAELDHENVRTLSAKGLGVREIARKIGASKSQVSRIVRKGQAS